MRVALIGPYPEDPSTRAGGIAAVTYCLAEGLRRIPDLELHVVAVSGKVEADRHESDGDFHVHYLMSSGPSFLPHSVRGGGRIREVLRHIEPDVVHSQTALGALAGVALKIPTVLTIHGIVRREIRYAKGFSGRVGTVLQAWLTDRALARVRHGIAISQYVVASYPRARRVRWHRIHNPVEDRFYEVENRDAGPKMLYAGLVSDRKNVLGLVQAFVRVLERAPEAQLFICGKIVNPDHHARVREFVERYELAKNIHLLGFISQEELARHFAEAAVICLFSNEETAPMIIAQAMCARKPVVATAAGGVPDLMRDGETGFVVDVGDERAFAEKSLALLQDEELRRRMGERGREVAERLFRADVVAAKTKVVYDEMLAEARETLA
jgi:glycosyltransferase involved in cell wall biosynthesis